MKPVAATSTPAPAWQAEWNRLVSAANQEGRIVVIGGPGEAYRAALTSFEKEFPGITVEYSGASPRDFAARLLAEREAGQFLVDVVLGGPTTGYQLKRRNVFDPLPPVLFRTDLKEDRLWLGGFDAEWQDLESQYVYAFEGLRRPSFFVNRDVVPESELKSISQLTDPKWANRITWNDPRTFGAGSGVQTHLLIEMGEPFLRTLYTNGVVATRDPRQQAEWIVRGTYPIATGLDTAFLVPMQKEGLGQNVKPLEPDTEAGSRLELGAGTMYLVNRAPHPNAAKLYVNWLLTSEAQTAWAQETQRNSRRLDVPGPAETRPDPNRKWGNPNHERVQELTDKGLAIAQELIK